MRQFNKLHKNANWFQPLTKEVYCITHQGKKGLTGEVFK
jgi:hypothetical protein